ncbi:MAG: T9SS type B sorting domain-containing protein [Chlorobi bacterium]|nr:T9SS type B sorting domain-containing protein [Chlorobiota bacterium]
MTKDNARWTTRWAVGLTAFMIYSLNLMGQQCVQSTSFTIIPPPPPDGYPPNTWVRMCYTVNGYDQNSTNWFHAVVIQFGNGWDLSSIIPYPAQSCDGQGTWGWYWSVTSQNTGNTYGPGFFYERGGNPNDPGDNYGDDCTNFTWTFCWDIKTKGYGQGCRTGNIDLSVIITPYGDSETGGWTDLACNNDPATFSLTTDSIVCCNHFVEVTIIPPKCWYSCDGKLIANTYVYPYPDNDSLSPYTYVWNTGDTAQVLDSVCPGKYFVVSYDSTECPAFLPDSIEVIAPDTLKYELVTQDITCYGYDDGQIIIIPSGGTPGYNVFWDHGDRSLHLVHLGPGYYSGTLVDSFGCEVRIDSVYIEEPPLLRIANYNITPTRCDVNSGQVEVKVLGGREPYNFYWSVVSNNDSIISGLPEGVYYLVVEDDSRCRVEGQFYVPTYPTTRIDMLPDTISIVSGQPMLFEAVVGPEAPDSIIRWYPGEFFLFDSGQVVTFTVTQPGIYDIHAVLTNIYGCQDTTYGRVYVIEPIIDAPNTFTPNGDGLNDIFRLVGANETWIVEEFQVFDRWGNLVYQNNYEAEWDGSCFGAPCTEGVYAYKARIRFLTGKVKEIVGNVALVR